MYPNSSQQQELIACSNLCYGHHSHHHHHHHIFQRNSKKRRWPILTSPATHSHLFLTYVFLYLFVISSSSVKVSGAKGSGNRHNSNVDRECNGIGNVIRNKGFTYPWWETSPLHNDGLMLMGSSEQKGNSSEDSAGSKSGCPVGSTGAKGVKCCKGFDTITQKNEIALRFNEKWMGPKLSTAADIFKERKKKFDITFKDLLTRAHGSFHNMFERT